MKITKIETIALLDLADGSVTSWNPSFDESSGDSSIQGAYSATVVRVHTDEGIVGIGQSEAPSLVIDAIIRSSQGLEALLPVETFVVAVLPRTTRLDEECLHSNSFQPSTDHLGGKLWAVV